MSVDVGEVITRRINITDSSGTAVNADSLPTYAITLPDGTAGTPPTVTSGATGEYFVNYLTTVSGPHFDVWTATVGGLTVKFGPDMFLVRAGSPAPLLGLVEARRHLRIPSTDAARDEEIRDFLDAATELCEDHVGRAYRRRTIVEQHDGGRGALLLRLSPVASVTSVAESGTTLTAGDYTLDAAAGVLHRGSTTSSATWACGRQNVSVTYVTAVAGSPGRVRQAVKVTLAHLWRTQRGGELPRLAGNEDDYAAGAAWSLPRAAEELLGPDYAPGFA